MYKKDLLLHEAHRHPYLDRLAALYLLKLNLGDSFATRAGSCWRLLYVLTLMPWLKKYHVSAKGGGENDQHRDPRVGAGSDNKVSIRESILEGEVARLQAELKEMKSMRKIDKAKLGNDARDGTQRGPITDVRESVLSI